MRFAIELLLEEEMIPKEKNRMILSILKSFYNGFDSEYYKSLYENTPNKSKEFTFALYLGNCTFLKEEIHVQGKKMILNFSSYNYEDGIMFYNSFMKNRNKKYPIKNNTITIGKINLANEKTIFDNQVCFKTLSPIVIREHNGDNKHTWYHSLSNKEGQDVFMNNLKYQLGDFFGERALLDFKDIDVDIQGSKDVKVKNYGIKVLSNITRIKVKAQPYILDYIYKAGVGSKRGSGFGMLEID